LGRKHRGTMIAAMKPLVLFALAAPLLLAAGCSREEAASEAGGAVATSSESHAAHMHENDATKPVLPEGERWATDEPLRASMLKIRAGVEATMPAYQSGALDANQARSLSATIEQNVAYMIQNCKLEPEPDAALHVLIGRMMTASEAMKREPASPAGWPELMAVLRDYTATFDHPGWKPIETH
jgi:hypothetical protein